MTTEELKRWVGKRIRFRVQPRLDKEPLPEAQEGVLERVTEEGWVVVDGTAREGWTLQLELREGGPTLEEYVAAGYQAENYPPVGYAPRTEGNAGKEGGKNV